MLPRWHIVLGIIFTLLLWVAAPHTPLIYFGLVLFASIFIDIDHYLCSLLKTGQWSLFKSFDYHKKEGEEHMKEHVQGIRKKGDFHFLHTVESHALIGILGLFLAPFFYIFIGMVFHSLLDVLYMARKDVLYRREYLFSVWLGKNILK